MNTDKNTPHAHTTRGVASTSTGVHSHSLTATDAALAALDARLKALEGTGPVEPPPPPPPPPPPVEPPPTSTITVPKGGKGVTITKNGQIVENLAIVGPGSATYDGLTYGIFSSGAFSDVVIRNCTIKGMGHSGMWLGNLTNLTIEDCVVEDCAYSGVMLLGVLNANVRRVTVRRIGNDGKGGVGNNAYGLCASHIGSQRRCQDILFEDCLVDGVPMWHGIDTHGGLRITWRRCTVRHAPRAVFLTSNDNDAKATDCVVENCLLTDPVQVTGGTNPTWATLYATVGARFTNNRIGAAYNSTHVYDYQEQSTGLTESGNTVGETLP